MSKKTRVVFTQGGKGGVGKTEVLNCLINWYREQGFTPVLLDFDIENTNKSGLQNFFPEATKIDVHHEGALDEFFDIVRVITLCKDRQQTVVRVGLFNTE